MIPARTMVERPLFLPEPAGHCQRAHQKGGQLNPHHGKAQQQSQRGAEAGAAGNTQGIRGGKGIGKEALESAAGGGKSRACQCCQQDSGQPQIPKGHPGQLGNCLIAGENIGNGGKNLPCREGNSADAQGQKPHSHREYP